MYCMNCGIEIPNNAKFCMNCGIELSTFSKEKKENLEIDVWNFIPKTDREKLEYIKKVMSEFEDKELLIQGRRIFCLLKIDNDSRVYFTDLDDYFGWNDFFWKFRTEIKDGGMSLKSAIRNGHMFPLIYLGSNSNLKYWSSEECDNKVFILSSDMDSYIGVVNLLNSSIDNCDLRIHYRTIEEKESKRILISYENKSFLFDDQGKILAIVDGYVSKGIFGLRYACLTNLDDNDKILDMATGLFAVDYLFRGVAFYAKRGNLVDEKIVGKIMGISGYFDNLGIFEIVNNLFMPDKDCLNRLEKQKYVYLSPEKYGKIIEERN